MIINIAFLSEVCPVCGEVLAWEWGFWNMPEEFHWESPSFEILALIGE